MPVGGGGISGHVGIFRFEGKKCAEASTAPLLAAHLSGRELPLESNGSLLFRGIETRCEILDTGALTPAERLEGLRSYL